MGFFDQLNAKLKKAKASGGGNYIQPGSHKLRVKSARFTEDRNDIGMFVAEFEVLETTNKEENHGPGRQVDYVIKSTNEAYFGNIKGLLLALYETDDDEWNKQSDEDCAQILEDCFGEAQSVVGKEVMCDAITATAKKIKPGQTEPNDYTRVRWSSVKADAPQDEEQTQASAEA